MSALTRALIDGLMPQGDAFRPAPGGNLDNLLNGIADNLGTVQTAMSTLATVRDPWTTPYLDELERDFGVSKNLMLTDAQRRGNLAARKFQRNQPGTALALQTALNLMGFGVGGCGLLIFTNEGSGLVSTTFSALSQTHRSWFGMCATPSGNVYACDYNGDIYMQTAGTGAFAALGQTYRGWYGMAATPSGNVYACDYGGDIYMQTAGTGAFVALSQTHRGWIGMCATPSGNVYAGDYNGDIYQSYTNFTSSADPNNFVRGIPWAMCGYTPSAGYGYMGNTYAFMGISGGGGTLIVNGNLYSANAPNYFGMGMSVSKFGYMGQDNSMCGYFTSLGLGYSPIVYTIGADPGYWPLYFFLAASAVYSSGTILSMGMANVPAQRQQELYDLICRYKPMHTWCIVMANFI